MVQLDSKICRICKKSKSLEDFHLKKSHCKLCNSGYDLYRRYGITQEQYNQMLLDQQGGCAICGRPPDLVGTLTVDHDHLCCSGRKTCGQCLRGLLCGYCNRGLGMFLDDTERLMKAYKYLKERQNIEFSK